MQCISSVSYTHLDVYKRQEQEEEEEEGDDDDGEEEENSGTGPTRLSLS